MGLFQWKIIDNIFAPGILNLAKDGTRIISVISIVPRILYVLGTPNVVGELNDGYTEPEYQGRGIAAILCNQSTKVAIARRILYIYGLPNNKTKSLPIWEKSANFKIVSNVSIKSLLFPLNIRPLTERYSHWLFGVYTAAIFSTFIYCYSLIKRAFIKNGNTRIDELEQLPDDWDNFWDKARLNYDFIFSRDHQAMEWRYFKNPEKYKVLVLWEGSVIAGYIVCRPIYDLKSTTLYVADFLTLPGREEVLEILLFRVLQDALRANVHFISVWCVEKSPYFQIFRRFGFLTRSGIPMISYRNDFAKDVEAECRTWHFTIGDSDNI